MSSKIENAKIVSTEWRPKGGILGVEGYGWHEGVFVGPDNLEELLDCLEVECWEKLKGLYVRVAQREATGADSRVVDIGHIMKNNWAWVNNGKL